MTALPNWLATWWRGQDTGLSSRTIAIALAGNTTLLQTTNQHDLPPPSDTSDVGRCVRLLDLAETNGAGWRGRMDEVTRVCPAWAPLIPRWAEIEAAYREDWIAQREAETARWRRKDGSPRIHALPFRGPPSRCWWLVATISGRYDPYDQLVPHPFAGGATP